MGLASGFDSSCRVLWFVWMEPCPASRIRRVPALPFLHSLIVYFIGQIGRPIQVLWSLVFYGERNQKVGGSCFSIPESTDGPCFSFPAFMDSGRRRGFLSSPESSQRMARLCQRGRFMIATPDKTIADNLSVLLLGKGGDRKPQILFGQVLWEMANIIVQFVCMECYYEFERFRIEQQLRAPLYLCLQGNLMQIQYLPACSQFHAALWGSLRTANRFLSKSRYRHGCPQSDGCEANAVRNAVH